jgi:hypothetical protein
LLEVAFGEPIRSAAAVQGCSDLQQTGWRSASMAGLGGAPFLFRVASRVDHDREQYQGDSDQQNSDKSCHG